MDTGIYKELPKNVAYDVPDFLGSVMELTDIVFIQNWFSISYLKK